MTNKDTILIDQDGVLADTMGAVMDSIHRATGHQLCHADIKDYWFKNMTVEPRLFVDALREEGLYSSLDVITGAVQGVNRLRERYDDNVVVVTSPMSGVEDSCEAEKRSWLAHHFDREFADRAIVTSDKTKILGRLLIEDNPDTPQNANWELIIFNQPWNRHVLLPRMYGWGDLHVVEGLYGTPRSR